MTASRPGQGTEAEPLLEDAERAFREGHFARVRELGERLARSGDPEVRRAGVDLVRRVSGDPLAIALFAVSALFFALVVNHYVF